MLAMAVGLAMDAFAVSIALGVAFRRREHWGAFKIAFSFGLFQAGMPVLGWLAGFGLRRFIEAFDHWVAFGLLAFLGGRMIFEAIDRHRNGEELEIPGTARLLSLSIATSIDALAVGFTISLLQAAIFVPALVIGGVTFAISYAGIVIGHELLHLLGGRFKRDVGIAGGIVLILIGVKILMEHVRPF